MKEGFLKFRTHILRDSITRPSNITAYAQYDVISEATSNDHFTFGGGTGEKERLAMPNVNSGVINAVRLWSSANVTPKLDAVLWLFRVDIAEVADNSPFAPTDTEMLTLVGIIDLPLANWRVGTVTAGADGNAVCEVRNIDLPFLANGTGALYGQLVANNAYVPISGEIFTVDLVVTVDG